MDKHQIKPEKITKPIQLLAAWLVGLILINTLFLSFALKITTPEWVPGFLVIASILNVPVFIGCIFLLQTKFRPQLQEDAFYSKYLESSTGKIIDKTNEDKGVLELKSLLMLQQKEQKAVLSKLENDLFDVSKEITTLVNIPDEKNLYKKDLEELQSKITKSKGVLKNVRQTSVFNDTGGIAINDLLPNLDEIIDSLAVEGLSINSTFGSSSASGSKIPRKKVLGFGINIDIKLLKSVAKVCWNNDFKYIHHTKSYLHQNRAIIGSYIYESKDNNEDKEVEFTEEIFNEITRSDSSLDDILKIIDNSRKK